MIWISIPSRGFVINNFVRGFFYGLVNGVISTFTDADILRFKDSEELLRNCEPWENHIKDEAYSEINKALKRRDY